MWNRLVERSPSVYVLLCKVPGENWAPVFESFHDLGAMVELRYDGGVLPPDANGMADLAALDEVGRLVVRFRECDYWALMTDPANLELCYGPEAVVDAEDVRSLAEALAVGLNSVVRIVEENERPGALLASVDSDKRWSWPRR